MLKKSFELRFNESYDAYRKKNSIRNSITIKVKQENIHNGVKVSNKEDNLHIIKKKSVTSGKKRLHALKIYRAQLKYQYNSKHQRKKSKGELLKLIFKLIDKISKRANDIKWVSLKQNLGKKIFDITPNYPAMEMKVTTSPKIVLGDIKQIIGFYNKYFKFYKDLKITKNFIKVIEKIEVYFAKNGANPLVYFKTTGKKIPLKDHWEGTKLVLMANILSHHPIKQNIINNLYIQEDFIIKNNKDVFRCFLVRILKNKAHLKLKNLEKIRSFIERLRFPQDFFKEKKDNPKITIQNLIKNVEKLYLKAYFHEVNNKANTLLLLGDAKKIIDDYPIIKLKYTNNQNTVTGCNLSPKHIYKYIYESLRKSCCTAILQKNGLKDRENPIIKYYEKRFANLKTINEIYELLDIIKGYFKPLIKHPPFKQAYNSISAYASQQARIAFEKIIQGNKQNSSSHEAIKNDLMLIIKKDLLARPRNIIHNKNISFYINILKLFSECKKVLTIEDYEDLNKLLLSSKLTVEIGVDVNEHDLYYYDLSQRIFCQCMDKISNEIEKKEFRSKYKNLVKSSNKNGKKNVSEIKKKIIDYHGFILSYFLKYKEHLKKETVEKIQSIVIDKPKNENVEKVKKHLLIIKNNYVEYIVKQPQKYKMLCKIFTKHQNIFTLNNVKSAKNKDDYFDQKIAALLIKVIKANLIKIVRNTGSFKQLEEVCKKFGHENPIISSLGDFKIKDLIKNIIDQQQKSILKNTLYTEKLTFVHKRENILFVIKRILDGKLINASIFMKLNAEIIDYNNINVISILLQAIKSLNNHWNDEDWILFGKFLDSKKIENNLRGLKNIWAYVDGKHLKALLNKKKCESFISKINKCRFLKLTIKEYLKFEGEKPTKFNENDDIEFGTIGNQEVQKAITDLFIQGKDDEIIYPLIKLCGTNEQNQMLLANIEINDLGSVLGKDNWLQGLANFNIKKIGKSENYLIGKASKVRKEKLCNLITTKISEIILQIQKNLVFPEGLFKKLSILCKILEPKTDKSYDEIFEIIRENLTIEKLQSDNSIFDNSCELLLALGNVSKKQEIFDEMSKLFAYYKLRFNRGESKKTYKNLLSNIEKIEKTLGLNVPNGLSKDEYIKCAKQLFKEVSEKKLELLYTYYTKKDFREVSDADMQMIVNFMLEKNIKDSIDKFKLLLQRRNNAKKFYEIWKSTFKNKPYEQFLQQKEFISFTIDTIELLSGKEIQYIIKQCNELGNSKQDEKTKLLKLQLSAFDTLLQNQPYTHEKLVTFHAKTIIIRANVLDEFPDIYIPSLEFCNKIAEQVSNEIDKDEVKKAICWIDFHQFVKCFKGFANNIFDTHYLDSVTKDIDDLKFDNFKDQRKLLYKFSLKKICNIIEVLKLDEKKWPLLLDKMNSKLTDTLKNIQALNSSATNPIFLDKNKVVKVAGKIQFSHNLPSYEFCKKLLFLIDLIHKNLDEKYDSGKKYKKTFHELFNNFAKVIYELAKNSGIIYCDVVKYAVNNNEPEELIKELIKKYAFDSNKPKKLIIKKLIKEYAFLREFFVYAVIDNTPECVVNYFANNDKKSIDKWKQDKKSPFLLTYEFGEKDNKKVKSPNKILYKKTPYSDDSNEILIDQDTKLYKDFKVILGKNKGGFFAKKITFTRAFKEISKYLDSKGIILKYYSIRNKFPMALKIDKVKKDRTTLDIKYMNIKLECLTVEKVETEKNAKKKRKSVKKPIKTLKNKL
ncbi:MAG: hypothetical protein PVI75_07815 [Gammaproteobacteria bacterium]|jgi:hypothetical protein